jgi:hypothetical protein
MVSSYCECKMPRFKDHRAYECHGCSKPNENRIKRFASEASIHREQVEFYATECEGDVLDIIGEDSCIEHFDIKVHHEPED